MAQTSNETPRLTLREAADRTGIPLDALRKRVYRGTVPAEKIDGQYTIAIDDLDAITTDQGHSLPLGQTVGETRVGHGSDTGETRDRTDSETVPDSIALDYIASLKDEITFLREQLDHSRRELAAERERSDVIQQLALQRIPPLAVGETRTDPLVTSPEPHHATESTEATQDASQSGMTSTRRRWWEIWKR